MAASYPHIDFNSDNLKLRLRMDIPADSSRVGSFVEVVDAKIAVIREAVGDSLLLGGREFARHERRINED